MLDRRFSRRATLKAAGGIALASALPTHAFAAAAANGPNVTPMPGIKGNLEMWDWSDAPSIPGEQAQAEFYTKFFPGLYKNLHFRNTIFGYTDLLPKLTVAWRSGSRAGRCTHCHSMVAAIRGRRTGARRSRSRSWGFPFKQFLPGALLSCRKNGAREGPLYGIPTNNEVMFLLYNKALFKQGGPRSRKTAGRPGRIWFPIRRSSTTRPAPTATACARSRTTATRRIASCRWRGPMAAQIFDELDPHPTWKKVGLGDDGVVEALTSYHQMFSVDKSVQPSALSDNQSNVETLFLDGKMGDVHRPSVLPAAGASS